MSARKPLDGKLGGDPVPDGVSCKSPSGKEHANIDRSGLNDGGDGNDDTHHLHEADTTEFIRDGSLGKSTKGLASYVNGYDLCSSQPGVSAHDKDKDLQSQ